ncbi:MAG: hypothetical protein IPG01_13230 [Chitinophagaceae bacterium]|nr:hypothetical protein [Chitinophagaceae bacterium]
MEISSCSNKTPSSTEIDLTKKDCQGGKLLDLNILDHVIITTERYYSFADEGII